MTEQMVNRRPEPRAMAEVESVYLYQISLSSTPLSAPDMIRLKEFLGRLIAVIAERFQIEPEYFVQTRRIITEEWRALLTQHASFWSLQTGVGMRPNRPAAGLPKPEDLMKNVMAGGSGGPSAELDLVYHLGRDRHFERFYPGLKWPSSIDVYLGSGGVAAFLMPDGAEFLERARRLYLPGLDAALKNLDFFLPLIGLEDFERATAEQTETWFNLFDVYIAETPADHGILIASRYNLDDLLANFQSEVEYFETSAS
ncbi:MAG TPA: hypothetical protein VJ302_20220 [Blastocatellia bacterium]|nr:hypothetical protein [Blastocatellia bacterium]